MAIQSIQDSKILRKYMRRLGRKGIAERIIGIAQEIVKQEGVYQSTIMNAGMIHALALACAEDSYWHEKARWGFREMCYEAERAIKQPLQDKEEGVC